MSNVWWIARRELNAYLRSPVGYVIAAAVLLGDGIWFLARALGPAGGKRLSAAVLNEFFYGVSGMTMFACVALTMRLLAQEREQGTLVLLRTAPVSDRQIVLGKFFAVFAVMLAITAISGYMPALIFVHGRVSIGHILVGYTGVLLLAAATSAIGLFASALAPSQIVAVIIGAALTGTMVLLWLVARISDPPIHSFIDALALHHQHQRPFMSGLLRLDNVVYYVAVTFFFLLAATKTLEARRWQ